MNALPHPPFLPASPFQTEQMYTLLAICMVLHPQRIDEVVQSSLREKTLAEKMARMSVSQNCYTSVLSVNIFLDHLILSRHLSPTAQRHPGVHPVLHLCLPQVPKPRAPAIRFCPGQLPQGAIPTAAQGGWVHVRLFKTQHLSLSLSVSLFLLHTCPKYIQYLSISPLHMQYLSFSLSLLYTCQAIEEKWSRS